MKCEKTGYLASVWFDRFHPLDLYVPPRVRRLMVACPEFNCLSRAHVNKGAEKQVEKELLEIHGQYSFNEVVRDIGNV